MKITIVSTVTVDGVLQLLGRADRAARGDQGPNVRAMPLLDYEADAILGGLYTRASAFMFGRWTYDALVGMWGPTACVNGNNPIVVALNTKPKFVVSSSQPTIDWAATTVISEDLDAAMERLRVSGEGELQVHGSGKLVRWLLANDLVDEIHLLTIPLVMGRGTRLFAEEGPDVHLHLLSSYDTTGGIIHRAYAVSGRPA